VAKFRFACADQLGTSGDIARLALPMSDGRSISQIPPLEQMLAGA
jgi:hypothetical protein